jgi:glycosyltransferase involved in cell wall biosynthesis
MSNLNIVALEPYYGGSHKVFIDKIISESSHNWNLLTLPAYKWKWRMTHSAYTFSRELRKNNSVRPDVIFCSDMLNLAEFRGLAGEYSTIPVIAYFHENQLAYPKSYDPSRDFGFEWMNMTTALSADQVWFNSHYHKELFFDKMAVKIKKAQDFMPSGIIEEIKIKSSVIYQWVMEFPEPSDIRKPGPLRILWSARWEQDKNPEDFFNALKIIKEKGIDFSLSVVGGGNARNASPVFEKSRKEFAGQIENWGYIESKCDFENILINCDIVVSTAMHEFFGISVAEAVSAGAFPVVPDRLAYPEVLREGDEDKGKESFFYGESADDLAEKLISLAALLKNSDSLWEGDRLRGVRKIRHFYPENIISEIDQKIVSCV